MNTTQVISKIKEGQKFNLLSTSDNTYIRLIGGELTVVINGKFSMSLPIGLDGVEKYVSDDLKQYKTLKWGIDTKFLPNTGTTVTWERHHKKMSAALHK